MNEQLGDAYKRLSDLEAKCARLEIDMNNVYSTHDYLARSPEKKETPKEFSGHSTATPKYCHCPKDMPCDCGYDHDLGQKFNPSPVPENTLEGKLRTWLKENHNKHLTANHWKQALISGFKKMAESHYRERFEKAASRHIIPQHVHYSFINAIRRELFGEKEGK